jgi:2-polyprenyl-3-methyl-5-hydroxy-6-metoxy-1,4-benzoquinol methylase
MTESRPASHFKRLYQANPDPWGFQSSPYEQAKYRTTVDALDARRFASGLEVGCSIGVLTQKLAPSCARLLGIDLIEDPLIAARSRCAEQSWVRFARMRVPAEWPADRFDLIVLSEVLYFLSAGDIGQCARHVINTLLPGGLVVLVNWSGTGDDPSSGDLAPERFIAAIDGVLRVFKQQRHDRYRLELLTLD